MDPRQLLISLLHNLHDGNYEEAANELEELKAWEDKGGFAPDMVEAFRAFCADACIPASELLGVESK